MSPAAPNFIERPQWYVSRFSNAGLAPGYTLLGKEVQTDTDAPFRMTGVAIYVFAADGTALGAAGNSGLTFRFTRPDGTWVQKHLIPGQTINPYDSGAVNGAGGQPAPFYSYFSPLGTNIFYPAGSSIQMDLTVLPAVTDALVVIVFLGTKMYRPGAAWAPQVDLTGRLTRPYFGYSIQPVIPSSSVPFNVNPDADFIWQYGAQTTLPSAGVLKAFGVKFRDWTGKYFMNDFVPADLIFGYDNSQTPGLLYPEIYIPKNQALYFDFALLP